MEQTELSRPRNNALALFLTFSRITLSGFGGLTFWTRYVLVERQRWLTQREFLDLLVLAQLLPGPNALNLTVMVGYRFGRWTGAAAAGLLLAFVIKLATVLPRRLLPWLFGALAFVGVGVLHWPVPWVVAALGPWAVA